MPLAARACFSSCLSSQSHFIKFIHYPEAHIKIVRAADPVFDLIGEIAKAANASEATLGGISFGRKTLKTIRDILNLVHIFMSVIPALIYALKIFFDLVKSLFTRQNVPLNPFKKESELGFNEIAKSPCEKFLVLAAISAKCVKEGVTTSSFALHSFIEEETHNCLLLAKHSSAGLGYAFEMGFYIAAYSRVCSEVGFLEENYTLFVKKIFELALGLLEKGLQLLYDVAKILEGLPPAWFRLPLTLLIASLGLYKVWLKTEIAI